MTFRTRRPDVVVFAHQQYSGPTLLVPDSRGRTLTNFNLVIALDGLNVGFGITFSLDLGYGAIKDLGELCEKYIKSKHHQLLMKN